MKKRQKRFLGCFGLAGIAAMTVFAASLPPTPDTSALSSDFDSTTDTISVRVVGAYPDVNILQPSNDVILSHPNLDIEYEYFDSETVEGSLIYTDAKGNMEIASLPSVFPNYQPGTNTLPLDLDLYGYGEYEINFTATGLSVYDEDTIRFSYVPVIVTLEGTTNDGDPILGLDFDAANVGKVEINAYSKTTGEPLFNPILVYGPVPTTVTLPFDAYGAKSDDYIIRTTAYGYDDLANEPLYLPFDIDFTFSRIPVPDTGLFLKKLNIARADYLLSGLVIFIAIAIAIIIFFKRQSDRK